MQTPTRTSGNILFYILIAIVLIGFLTLAIRDSGGMGDNIDRENLGIKATQVQRQASEVARVVQSMIDRGISESDIRFAHPSAPSDYGLITTTPQNQVFSSQGGQAGYPTPPSGVFAGAAQTWEFFGHSDGVQSGSNRADLMAVLPDVSLDFCTTINAQLGYTIGTQPADPTGESPDCVKGAAGDRFLGTFDSTPNTLTAASFSRTPAYQGCVLCASDGTYNYFYVLLAR